MKRTTFTLLYILLIFYSSCAIAQSLRVKGTVRSERGPLQGVSVVVKATGAGATTDAAGNFSIQANKSDTLSFSYSGYLPHEMEVGERAAFDILMSQNVAALEEVVVIGYGSKKREFLTGAVSTVNSEVMQSRPIANAMSALQGQVPGLVIQRSSGQPGAEGFDLNVRGYSSTNGGNSPLVLIDGIAGGNLDLLNPADIESISVLKDAAASIYGARAAGGVVLVTTKKGRKGIPKISYSTNAGISKMAGMMESPTNLEMAIMDNEANIHNGAAPMYTPELLDKIRNNDPNPIPHPIYGGWMLFFTNTDWIKEVMENGFQHKLNINISGGGNNSTYFLSGGYINQQGVIKYANDNNERYNLRLNYDYDFSKGIRLETNISMENQNRSDIGGLGTWVITEAVFGMPNHPVYTTDGKFFAQGGWGNAVAQAKEAEPATFNTRNINTNFRLIGDVFNDLKLNLLAGINYRSQNNRDIAKSIPLYNWDGTVAYYTIANPGESSLTLYNSHKNTYRNFTGYFQYNKKLADKHDIDIMAGASHEENDFDWFSARRDNFVTEDVWSLNLGGTNNMSNNGGGDHWAIRSLFSRVGYVFNNKYMVEGNLRYDGSSRFHSATRWGLFPGISAGWRLSQENFMKDVRFFNDVKIRASYGETGNQEGIRLHDYLQLINMGGSYSFGAGGQAQAASLDTMASPTRTWETMINKNIGVDVVMLSSKLNFSFDYFIKRNEDMLVPVTYPSVLGAVAPSSNSGELKTWGFETSLGWKDKVGKLDYSVRVLLSDSKNKVVYYGGANTYVPGRNFVREGYPINTYFAYEFDGLIRTQKLDERTLVQLYGFQGYNTLTSEFQNRDPRMAMTFIVPGSNIFFEGGIMQPTYPGFTGSNATHTGYMIRKFLDETIDAATFRGQYDFKEFRYGEVLLILAEALYEQNNSISDQDLNRTINVVRSRVNMPALTNAFVTANGLNMLDEIRRERTVELAFEGFRRDDLRRWKLAETMMPQALKGVNLQEQNISSATLELQVGVDIQVDDNGFIVAEPANARQFLPKHYLDPIPLQQIQLSKGTLTQNTGW